MAESESNKQAIGCGTAEVLAISLLTTIVIVHHFNGFWYCFGAFLVFFISGALGASLGVAIGMAIGKAQSENDFAKQIGFSLIGGLIGNIAACNGAGKLIYGINALSLLTRKW